MRRRRPEKREILPDPVYGDLIVAKFINNLMKQGKKSLAEKIFYQSIEKIKKQGKVDDGIELFKKALENVAPILEVKSKRIGGATYQVPIEISEGRRMALAMRWLVMGARQRSGRGMPEKLSAELLDDSRGQGAAVRRKEEVFRMAEANRAFAHYRW